MHGLRRVRQRLRDYATLAVLYWGELETWVSHKVRTGRDAVQAVRSTESGPERHDHSYEQKFQALTEEVEIEVGSSLVSTEETAGFVNAQGYPGVVLVFKVDAAVSAAVAPITEPTHDVIAFVQGVSHTIGGLLAHTLVTIVDPEMEFQIFGESWTLNDLFDEDEDEDS